MIMPVLTIDDRRIEVEQGATILDAAARLGIRIPTLCHRQGLEPWASCMVCVVSVRGPDGNSRLVPSCASRAEEGMIVETDTEDVRRARRLAVELLLSDHLGDCIAPCQQACPARMDIPRMIRSIRSGDFTAAVETVREAIPLPGVLGRICSAPCEKACRRGRYDSPLSILLLKRFVADADLASASPYAPPAAPSLGRKVAVVGSGPAGLSAAYYLLKAGAAVAVFDGNDLPGGMLRYGVPEDRLPRDVLAAETDVIRRMGCDFRMRLRLGSDLSLDELRADYDAVFLALGETVPSAGIPDGLETDEHGIRVDRKTFQTGIDGVFAGGDCVRPIRMAVHSVAQGRTAAFSIVNYLAGGCPAGRHTPFSTHIGRLLEGEIDNFLLEGDPRERVLPAGGASAGLSRDEAVSESARCLHCDCRRQDDCRLRSLAEETGAKGRLYRYSLGEGVPERRVFRQDASHPDVIYEPGKCIACGICVRIAEKALERFGLAFVGRGFDVQVRGALDRSMRDALEKTAGECADACPTGAIVLRSPVPAPRHRDSSER
ncbi:MAG: (2Fe-2S)-binding protein [Planctomycetes bacterium]|nr:(2Fe-2S)-binding protein [Planctomycetota bacterium]